MVDWCKLFFGLTVTVSIIIAFAMAIKLAEDLAETMPIYAAAICGVGYFAVFIMAIKKIIGY